MRYSYKGHEVDVYIGYPNGYVAYIDNDLEPHDISEAEYLDVVENGEFISFFKN